jgi:hypothetical protein
MSQAVAHQGVRWRLGARTRKSVLLVQIASADRRRCGRCPAGVGGVTVAL